MLSKLMGKKEARVDEFNQFAKDELDAVRRRLDSMQKELDTALELAKQQANLANTALGEVARQNEENFNDLKKILTDGLRRIELSVDKLSGKKKSRTPE